MNVIKQKIKELRSEKLERENQIRNIVKSVWQEFGFEHTIGSWDCPKSPFGLCAYNHFEDPALDDCLFCHEPNERK